jgi:hypothetical protein
MSMPENSQTAQSIIGQIDAIVSVWGPARLDQIKGLQKELRVCGPEYREPLAARIAELQAEQAALDALPVPNGHDHAPVVLPEDRNAPLFQPSPGIMGGDQKRGLELRNEDHARRHPPPPPPEPLAEIIEPARTFDEIRREAEQLPPNTTAFPIIRMLAQADLPSIENAQIVTLLKRKTGMSPADLKKGVADERKKIRGGKLVELSQTERVPWREMLDMTDNQEPRATMRNAHLALSNDEAWQIEIAGEQKNIIAFNEYAELIVCRGPTPEEKTKGLLRYDDKKPFRYFTDADERGAMLWVQEQKIPIRHADLGLAVAHLADQNTFHPLKQYFESIVWDRIPRLDTWLSIYAGVEQTDLSAACGSRWMISGVARVLDPGCQV